ncbi:MAG: DUF4295 family protein [Ekhidna sp.]|nr:DUF4295 family protein [Ekhidna sp.]
MAKKVVAALKKTEGTKYAKVIKAIKNKNGSCSYREEMVIESEVKNALVK